MASDAELEAEQAHIEHAYACLERMQARAAALVGQSEDPDLEAALVRRVRLLADTGRPLCFGRIDEQGGQRWHIGRRHVEDEAADPVVVEWRAPVAVPFYRARPSDPLGLVRRRQFVLDGRRVASMADDVFGGPDSRPGDGADPDRLRPRIRGGDALLAELERARTGEMLDIVATIQAEQDEVIRAPLAGVLAVQGGPGTGKTAIGLHRAAFLLYAHPELARSGVLVIGPSRTFLRYIAMVLPSLGEEAVVQTTLADLVPEVRAGPGPGACRAGPAPGATSRAGAGERPEVERVKGDARMATVLAQALADRRGRLEEDLELSWGLTRVVLPAGEVNALVEALAARRAPYRAGRNALRDRLGALAQRHHARRVGQILAADPAAVAKALRNEPAFRAALDRLWPTVSAVALVRDLLSSPGRLARAAESVLDAVEQALLVGDRRDRAWTEADLPLVDEAQALITGQSRTYGHIMVDEAQDLSPMQLRMLARRGPAGSITVLGDLAQGTGPWAHDDWDEVLELLPRPQGARLAELRLGYRAPGQVLDLASRLLPEAAPQVRGTESVRPGRWAPTVARVASETLLDEAADEAGRLLGRHASVGVIVASAMVADADRALSRAGVDHGRAERDGLSRPVTLLAASQARGLELDAVVVVEPLAIMEDAPRGLRLLYICLTRPTQHCSIMHSQPLPSALVPQ